MSEEEVKYKRSVGVIEAEVEDACIEHGIRGHLRHADIQRMIAEYDDEDLQARVKGKFQHLTGLVFKQFSRKIHVIKPFRIKPEDYVVSEALDPHTRNPDAVMWLATDRKRRHIVVDELYGTFTTAELAERIKRKADAWRILMRICDPSAFVEDKHQDNPEEQTLASRLSDLGLDYEPATKDRRAADRRIKDAIDFEMAGDELLVAPELYIFDTCLRTIWELEHYQWDDWRGRAAERKSPLERPQDKDDHEIECLGRLLVQEPAWSPMQRKNISTGRAGRTLDDFDPN